MVVVVVIVPLPRFTSPCSLGRPGASDDLHTAPVPSQNVAENGYKKYEWRPEPRAASSGRLLSLKHGTTAQRQEK